MKKESDDKLKFRAAADGLEIEVSGRNVDDYHRQIQDLLSPLTEGLGFLGDQIRFRRMQTAVKVLQKLHELAAEKGFVLKPIESKFLIEALEKSSMEDPHDEEIAVLWAKLLASASEKVENAQVSYIDLLRVLRKEDAEMLKYLALDTSAVASLDFFQFYNQKDFCDSCSKPLNNYMDQNSDTTFSKILESLRGMALQFNYILLYIRREGSLVLPTDYFRENEKSISVLEREGAVKIEFGTVSVKNFDLEVCWLRITKFGFDFIVACEGLNIGELTSASK